MKAILAHSVVLLGQTGVGLPAGQPTRVDVVFASSLSFAARQPIKTGPDMGSKAPHFEAVDQNGQMQTLKTISGLRGAILVFFRSADW